MNSRKSKARRLWQFVVAMPAAWRGFNWQMDLHEKLLDEQARRCALKAKITKIGDIKDGPDGSIMLIDGWTFDCSNGAIESRFDVYGNHYYCGYSLNELREICAHREEWV